MSKLCKYCGAEMDDEAYECPECLKKIPGAEMIAKQKKLEKQQKLKTRLTIAGISVAFVAFITVIVVLVTSIAGSKDYTKPIDTLIKGCTANDYEKYSSAYPEYYRRFMNEQFAYMMLGDIPESEEKINTADLLYHNEYYTALIQRFGTDFDITYKVLSEKQVDADEIKRFQEEQAKLIEFYMDGASVRFEEAYELAITFNIKGNLGVANITKEQFMLIKVDGKWYVMSNINFLEEKEETNIENYR